MKRKRSRIIKDIDAILKSLVRARDNWTCQMCGAKHGGVSEKTGEFIAPGLDTCHVVPKQGHLYLRWMPDNLFSACSMKCHQTRWHSESKGHEWWAKKFPERYKFLYEERVSGRIRSKIEVHWADAMLLDFFYYCVGVQKKKDALILITSRLERMK